MTLKYRYLRPQFTIFTTDSSKYCFFRYINYFQYNLNFIGLIVLVGMDKNESDEDEKQCTSVSEEIQDESNSSEVSSNKSDSITELHKPRKQYSRVSK